MIFLSAGHTPDGPNRDPGAIAGNVQEANLTKELRDLIVPELRRARARFVVDLDAERVQQYVKRIAPGSGSVVCELHFNSVANEKATGVEVLVKDGAGPDSRAAAAEICALITRETGIINRGVKTESDSHRGRLGILRTNAGISILPEICFISNKNDLMAYNRNREKIAKGIAEVLVKYDALYD